MKTTLPDKIKTVSEAKAFLTALRQNNETFHPEDDAETIVWNTTTVTIYEAKQLNKLMEDIYTLPGNVGTYPNLAFEPCEFLLLLYDEYIKNTIEDTGEFTHTLSGNIVTVLEVNDSNYTLSFGNVVITQTLAEIAQLFRSGEYKF